MTHFGFNECPNNPPTNVSARAPDPIMTHEQAEAAISAADQQRRFYSALAHEAARVCTLTPEIEALEAGQRKTRDALDAHFFPRKDMPTKEYAFNTIWIDGAMAAISGLMAQLAINKIKPWYIGTPPKLGPARNYVIPERGILPYPEGSPEDLHMNMSVKAITDAAQQASLLRAKGTRYDPVFSLEERLRQSLPYESPPGAAHERDALSNDPLDYERTRHTSSQFLQNITYGTLLLAKGQPRILDCLDRRVRDGTEAIRIASTYPRDAQRMYMEARGEPYEYNRQKRGIIPEVVVINGYLRFKGMEKPAVNGTRCTGSGAHGIPQGFDEYFGIDKPLSSIDLYTRLSRLIAPFTLFQDAVRLYDPVGTLGHYFNDGLHIANGVRKIFYGTKV